jgi:hypothetical protein
MGNLERIGVWPIQLITAVCPQLVWYKKSKAFLATEFPVDEVMVLQLLADSTFDHLTRLLARETVIVGHNCAAWSLYAHLQAERQTSPPHMAQASRFVTLGHSTRMSLHCFNEVISIV